MWISEPKSVASAHSLPCEPHRERQQHRLFHAIADPAHPLAQQRDELHRDAGLALQEAEEIFAPQDEQLGRFLRGGAGGARLAVERGDLAEQVAGAEKVERQLAAGRGAGLDSNLAATDSVERVAAVALLEQHLACGEVLGMAECRNLIESFRAEIGEQRVEPQNDGEFRLLAHDWRPPNSRTGVHGRLKGFDNL